jgi:hypothetical protein
LYEVLNVKKLRNMIVTIIEINYGQVITTCTWNRARQNETETHRSNRKATSAIKTVYNQIGCKKLQPLNQSIRNSVMQLIYCINFVQWECSVRRTIKTDGQYTCLWLSLVKFIWCPYYDYNRTWFVLIHMFVMILASTELVSII